MSSTNGTIPTVPPSEPPPDKEEIYSSWALLLLITLLILTFFTSYFLQSRKIRVVHESLAAILAGAFAGLCLQLIPGTGFIQQMITFDHSYFFNLLLPPIILNSGYELKRNDFFRNFGTILTFAFAGTLITAFVTGFLIYLVVLTGLAGVNFTLLDSLAFGAVLSATDPVTVLAIFSQLRVDPKLFAVICGESLLNDAVAIVLFTTLREFSGEDVHFTNIIRGFGMFGGVFFGSLIIGVVVALGCALMLKHTNLREHPAIESCLLILLAYSTYLLPNAIHLSGIVSLLFCGMTLKHYAYDNLSRQSRRTTKYMFQVLAQLSENFIFIYLGVTMFTAVDNVYLPFFIICTLIIITVARYCSVFPLSTLINFVSRHVMRRSHDPMTRPHQIMLFWAGLRGAVAFALAFSFTGVDGPAARTTILSVVVLSIIGFGGTTTTVVQALGIRTGVGERDAEGDDSDDSEAEERRELARFAKDDTHWFLGFDDRWLKPFFARPLRPGGRYRAWVPRIGQAGPGTPHSIDEIDVEGDRDELFHRRSASIDESRHGGYSAGHQGDDDEEEEGQELGRMESGKIRDAERV